MNRQGAPGGARGGGAGWSGAPIGYAQLIRVGCMLGLFALLGRD